MLKDNMVDQIMVKVTVKDTVDLRIVEDLFIAKSSHFNYRGP